MELNLNRWSPSDKCAIFVAPNATILGDVKIDAGSSVWFGAVIRGDTEQIRIGKATNIQDLCCLHADPGYPCTLGDRVTLGHGAIVHGATVEEDCLIGIRAVVLNGAVIGRGSIVGAGALVKEGQIIEPNSVVMGIPARRIRTTTPEDVERIQHAAQHYEAASKHYAQRKDAWQ